MEILYTNLNNFDYIPQPEISFGGLEKIISWNFQDEKRLQEFNYNWALPNDLIELAINANGGNLWVNEIDPRLALDLCYQVGLA